MASAWSASSSTIMIRTRVGSMRASFKGLIRILIQ
jgi:hypothetical protein